MDRKVVILIAFFVFSLIDVSYANMSFGVGGFQNTLNVQDENLMLWKTLAFFAFYVSFIAAGGSLLAYVFYPSVRQKMLLKARDEAKNKMQTKIEKSIDVSKNHEIEKLNEEIKKNKEV